MNFVRPAVRHAVASLVLATAMIFAASAAARSTAEAIPELAAASLPREARELLVAIRAGSPHPYERDGVSFGNRERLLPAKPRAYYREYTVRTPGTTSRGARRIVCGGPVQSPDTCYYSADHYQSFARIRE